jgi:hypothetical protein
VNAADAAFGEPVAEVIVHRLDGEMAHRRGPRHTESVNRATAR